jgi:hypothetical protein
LVLFATRGDAQVIRGTVVEEGTENPVPGAVVRLLPADRDTVLVAAYVDEGRSSAAMGAAAALRWGPSSQSAATPANASPPATTSNFRVQFGARCALIGRIAVKRGSLFRSAVVSSCNSSFS